MNCQYLVLLLFIFERSFAFKANHQISQPTKNIFSNKKCQEIVTPARYLVQNKNVVYDEVLPCDDTSRLAQFLPEMNCPASIMEASRPFFYKTCETSAMLGPFSDDVKSTYYYMLEKNKKALEEVRAKYMNDFTVCPITNLMDKTVNPTVCSSIIPDEVEVFDTDCELFVKKEPLCKLLEEKEIAPADTSSESDENDEEADEGLVDLTLEGKKEEVEEDNNEKVEEKKGILEETVKEKLDKEIDTKEDIKEDIEKKLIKEEDILEENKQPVPCSSEIIKQESCECDDLTPLLETLLICEDILEDYDCSTLFDDLEEKEISEEFETQPKEVVIKVVDESEGPEILLKNLCRSYPLTMKTPNKISTKCNKPRLDKSLLDKLKRSRYYNACPNKELYTSCPTKRNVGEYE